MHSDLRPTPRTRRSMNLSTRPVHPSDLPQLYRICLRTANADGTDGTHLFEDPDLMGHFYVGPYASLEPELCFVLQADDAPATPAGYICATRDIAAFRRRCEDTWFPPLRRRYPLPDASDRSGAEQEFYALIHEGIDLNADAAAYPARLHIALLPELQRRGGGRLLMDALLERLNARAVPAVHLEVNRRNTGAIAFYEALGFHRVAAYPQAYVMGRTLA